MELFQKLILEKYINLQDKKAVNIAYEKYQKYFFNTERQQNIRESKEEQFQEGFLRELFVNILGYTINPEPFYDLTTEFKNEINTKKADGAILKDGKALAVIELKSTKIKDLENIRQQAFDYKANQSVCIYVITSNFEKLRFYINNAVNFEEFNLFTLNKTRFSLLYLCIAKDNLIDNIPLKIKKESLQEEEQITKKFYADYSLFKRELFRDLVKQNLRSLQDCRPVINTEHHLENKDSSIQKIKLSLFKKSQKLIDRFLFIFFAEDRGLLPPNSTLEILNQWKQLKALDEDIPLYNRFKKYFNYLDIGRKGTDKNSEIFAYNGGLFKPDETLDSLLISDELLYKHTKDLSHYDFESQVDVNILGHIFENSLNEIENVNAEIEGVEFVKQKSKRKKDGVFYTPKYITKYIVDNTVGKLCSEKKIELDIIDDEYHKSRKGRAKKILVNLKEKLENYRQWLLKLTIVDPACGSGAFLNQALDFLIKEHHYVDELQTTLLGGGFVFANVENTVLENNIYGVDINEESVEIAKLSLWLRTAKPRRQLNDLSKNIKCGNSLIGDPEVAGDKAFKWEAEFPNIFEEKEKKAFHITTATHDSRTSQRMIEYKVRELRDGGTRPNAEGIWLYEEDELLITQTIAEIVKEDNLNVMAYNICGDHLHLLLVCDEKEIPKIMQKLKSKTSRIVNINKGITTTREHAPLSSAKGEDLHAPTSRTSGEEQYAPLSNSRGEKQNSLWTQKYGCKEITSDEQLFNTIEYIKFNREKHQLPPHTNNGACSIAQLINKICCTYDHANRTEYKGGFDVVIGNPPYVQVFENLQYYDNNFVTSKCGDLYALFYERGIDILRVNGMFSYITPSLFIKGIRYESLRNFLLNSTSIIEIDDKGDGVFQDVQMPTAIVIACKKKGENQNWDKFIPGGKLISKIENNSIKLSTLSKIKRGLEIGKDKVTKFSKNDINILTGEDISRYQIKQYKSISIEIYQEYKKEEIFFNGERIIIRETGNRITALYVNESLQQNRSIYSILLKKGNYKFILGIINSSLMQFYYKSKFAANTDVFPKIRIVQVKNLPIKLSKNSSISKLVNLIASEKLLLKKIESSFLNYLKSQFSIEKLCKKLQNWHELEFGDFIKELNKALTMEHAPLPIPVNLQEIKHAPLPLPAKHQQGDISPCQIEKLTKLQEMEWMEVFEIKKAEAKKLKEDIDKTDAEIDAMVYKLYGLNEEEIKIVESS